MRLGRHAIGREIGRGGMGIVYEVVTAPGEPPLAVKVVLPHVLALPSIRERFLREAKLGISVDDPHVVRTLEVGEALVGGETMHYLVMERVHGRTLRALLEEMGSAPEGFVREIGAQAARGLAALHRAGIVHRDVKPENLLLAQDRRLRIMDLGVAKRTDPGGTLTSAGHFVGSIRYAAPEQWEGEEVGPAADLYALGVVLYELLTGTPPFDGEGLLRMARARLESAAPPVASRAACLSEFLGAVVDGLLERDPARRPSSAEALARVLEEGESGLWWAQRRKERGGPPPRPAQPAPALPLFGRTRELSLVEARWLAAREGRGQVVLVEGETGIGKSRLLEEFLRGLPEDARLLSARYDEAGPSKGVREALVAALSASDLDVEVARRLALPARRAAAIAAHLRGHAPDEDGDRLLDSEGAAWTARLLASLASEAPVLLVVENLHAAAEHSLRTLLALAREVAEHRILLLATTRPGLAASISAALDRLPGVLRLALPRLEPDDVQRLLAACVGDTAIAERLTPVIARRSNGIPLFVLELVQDLERRGHLVRATPGPPRLDPAFEEALLPGALREVLLARVDALGAEERATLDAASVQGDEFDPDLVARVRAVPKIHVLEVLARLERKQGLVRSGPRTTRFDPHLIQELLYQELPEALRAEAHGRLADALEAAPRAKESDGAHASRVTRHRIRGPEPGRALPGVAATLAHLTGTYRYAEALDFARRALALEGLSQGPARVEALLQAALASRALGNAEEVGAALDEAVALAQTTGLPSLRLATHNRRLSHWLDVGRYEEALRASEEVVALARADGRPAKLCEALMWRGQAFWCLGRPQEALATHEEARRTAHEAGHSHFEGRALADLGVVHSESGREQEAEQAYREALVRLRAAHDRPNEGVVLTNLGNVLLGLGRWSEALACYDDALAVAREVGDVAGEAFAWVNVGSTRLTLGDHAGALEAYARCEAICAQAHLRRVLSFVLHGRATAAAWQGDRGTARRLFEEALALRRRLQTRLGLGDTLLALGDLALTERRIDEARPLLDEAILVGRESGDVTTELLATLRRAALPGEPTAPAREAFDRHASHLRPDTRLEALLRLWELEGRREDLVEARGLLAELTRHAPPTLARSMVEAVPYRRAVRDAAQRVLGPA